VVREVVNNELGSKDSLYQHWCCLPNLYSEDLEFFFKFEAFTSLVAINC